MGESNILTQSAGWVPGLYYALSLLLAMMFLFIKPRQHQIQVWAKAGLFFIIFTASVAQFFVFRFGIPELYRLFGYIPDDEMWLNYSALMFGLFYAWCLPNVNNSRTLFSLFKK